MEFSKLKEFWNTLQSDLSKTYQRLERRERFLLKQEERRNKIGEKKLQSDVRFGSDPVWHDLNQKRILLESRVEIQRQVNADAMGYEQTTEQIKKLVAKSIPGLNLMTL